jgi:hypothetical protein
MGNRIRRGFSFALISVVLAGTPAVASLHPFVSGGYQRVQWEKKERNALMDMVTLRDGANAWEARGGVSLSAPSRDDRPSGSSALSFLLSVGAGGGSLPGNSVVNGSRFDGRRAVTYSSTETYKYTWWSVGPALMIRLPERVSISIGPSLQSVIFKAKRTWDGPSGFSESGPAEDKMTVRYGLLELGARVSPRSFPLFLEGSWTPFRASLSTSHELVSNNWTTANFSSFTNSLSVRLGYEF